MRILIFGLLMCLLLPAAALRFFDLERDPPLISGEMGAWVDPAYFLYNARSYALFHEWRAEEGHSLYVAPGYAFMAAIWFRAFGAGYAQAVLLSILAGYVLIVATAFYAESAFSENPSGIPRYWRGIAALVSLLLSYVLFALQRVPKADMESIALSALTALAFVELNRDDGNERRRRAFAFCAGLGVGLVPFVKLSSGLFSMAACAAWLASYVILDQEWKVKWRSAMPWVSLGVSVSLAVWLVWAMWLYRLNMLDYMLHKTFFIFGTAIPSLAGRAPDSELLNSSMFVPARFFQSNVFYRHPAETTLCTIAAFRLLAVRRLTWPMFFSIVWLLVGVVSMMFISATVRYRILFVPPALALATNLWAELAAGRMPRLDRPKAILVSLLAAGVLGYILAYSIAIRMLSSINWLSTESGFAAEVLVIYFAVAVFVWLVQQRLPQRGLAFAFAALLILVSLPQWWIGERTRSHDLRNAAQWMTMNAAGLVPGQWWGAQLALWTSSNCYLEWSADALRNVTLVVGEPHEVTSAPLNSHEIGRLVISPRRLTLVFAEAER
jgi:4-amino-4-deoxy-L-arabinose transferase-like glycosyltransferase